MSAKYFCDQCGVELSDNNRAPGGRVIGRLGRIQFEVHTAFNNCWNGGQFCSSCVISAVASLARLASATEREGWRGKCEVGNKSETEWWIRATTDDGLYLWYHDTTGWVGEPYQLNQPCYPSQAAARAALLAASEPPNPFHADIEREMLKPPTKPAPASTPAAKFDAEKMAAAMFKHNKASVDLNISQHDGERGYSVIISDKADAEMAKKCWRGYISAALTAAHAAGRAEGCPKPRKWPEGRPSGGFVLYWDDSCGNPSWVCTHAEFVKVGMWWLPQPAAPAAAKEGR